MKENRGRNGPEDHMQQQHEAGLMRGIPADIAGCWPVLTDEVYMLCCAILMLTNEWSYYWYDGANVNRQF